MSYVIPFHELEKGNIPAAGGKGANLGEMTMAGFPVPSGFVLTTEAYDAFVRAHGLQQQIVDLASRVSIDNPQSSEDASEKIKQLFLDARFTDDIAAVLLPAYAEMQEGAVAVRSSATAEDLPDASFAGQQESYLNVQGRESLLDAVKRCWASLWTARAITYRLKQAIAPSDVSLAVVVQRQIAADVSGVAFSLNPGNNCYDEAVIDSNFGLGETVVSGQVTPDNFVVNKLTKRILQKKLGTKDYVLVGKDGGGLEEKIFADPESASLSNDQVIAVTDLVTSVERHYGVPMDIEWAYANGKLYLLQARPITTHIPIPEMTLTEPGEEKCLYLDLLVLTQGFSDPLSVLGIEIWGKMLEALKGDSGLIDRGRDGTVLNVEGRQYLHLSNLMKAMGTGMGLWGLKQYDTPTRQIFDSIDLKRDYLPQKQPAALRGVKWSIVKSAFGRLLPCAYRGFRNPARAVQAHQEEFAQHVRMSKELATQDIDFQILVDELLDHFKSQMNTITAVMLPSMVARWRMQRLFTNDDVEDLLVALEMDLTGNPTSEMGHRMYDLAQSPEIQETETGEEFAQKLNAKAYSSQFMRAYEDYIDEFGCRCIREIDIATPRPYDNVPEFFNLLKAIDVESDLIHSASRRRDDAYEKLLALATRRGKANKFKRLAELHKNAGYREAPKYFFIIITDLMRRRALTLGEEFVARGQLDHATQVFDLSVRQITQGQQDSALPLLPMVEKNLAPRKRSAQVRDWPRVIDSRGKIFRAERRASKPGELVGDPIAPSVVSGTANVLHSPYEKPLKKGDILVTRATDPGWTPIFMNASGVVLEVGGALQHGAIIAREFGLPCVSGVDGATVAITDGQMIEVDGSNGIVRLAEAH